MVRLIYIRYWVSFSNLEFKVLTQPEQLKIFENICSNQTIDARDTVLLIHYRIERSSQPALTNIPDA